MNISSKLTLALMMLVLFLILVIEPVAPTLFNQVATPRNGPVETILTQPSLVGPDDGGGSGGGG